MGNIDYVYEVYKAKSFSIAAKKLFISQPALSTAIKKIETEIGAIIFDRSSFPLTLTDAGKVYIRAVEKINNINDSMRTELADLEGLKTGVVEVSGENFVSSFILPKILIEFYNKYPGITVNLLESNSPNLIENLLDEHIDLLIAHNFDSEHFAYEELFKEHVILAVPECFEINKELKNFSISREEIISCSSSTLKKKEVSISLFKDYPFLLTKKGNDMFARASGIFETAGIDPTVRMYFDQLITSFNMACAKMGIAFVTDILVKNYPLSGCVFYYISGDNTTREMSIGYKKSRYLSKAVRAFIETAKEVYQ